VVSRASLNQLLHSQRQLSQIELDPVVWMQSRARQEVLKGASGQQRQAWAELDAALSKFQTGEAIAAKLPPPPPPPDPTALLLDSLPPSVRPKAKTLLQLLADIGVAYDHAFRIIVRKTPVPASNIVDILCVLLRPPSPRAFASQRTYLSSVLRQTTGLDVLLRFLAISKLPLSCVRNCLIRDYLRQLRERA
jgi:hypothetical protein